MPTIHAHEYPILQIFSNAFAFKVPSYQRPYSWDTEHAGALLNDLLAASKGFSPDETDSKKEITPYFLGSVVLIKSEQAPESEVIDGQQRLTTLSLLLSALRVLFDNAKRRNTFASFVFEEGDSLVGTKNRCRLSLRERDHEFYENNILSHETLDQLNDLLNSSLSDPQRKLARNTQYLLDELRKQTPGRRDALAAYLLQHTYLVVVGTSDLDSAFRIFSVLNNRGLNLSVADILKAELIGKLDDQEQLKYVEVWEDAEEALGTDRFTELFSHIRMIHGRDKLRTTILEGFRQSFPIILSNTEKAASAASPQAGTADVRDAVRHFIDKELTTGAQFFSIILGRNFETADSQIDRRINRLLGLLSRLDNTDWIPPAIYYLQRNHSHPAQIESFLKDLERLAAIMWLLRKDENDRIDRYGEILQAIDNNTDLSSKTSPLQLSTDEMQQAVRILDGNIYEMTPKKKRTMLLLRLDEALSSGEATYDFDQITVEHVLPQTPPEESEWCGWWPEATQREKEVHRLGNLALLNRRQNSAAKNWPFVQKKQKYFLGRSGVSPFAMTTEVVAKLEWKPDDFAERQRRFLNLLQIEWRLDS